MSELGLMCFIMLETPSQLNPATVREALAEAAPRCDVRVRAQDPGDGGSGLVVEIDGNAYAVISEPGRMPDEICAMVRTGGIFWAEREQDLENHDGFLAISATEVAKGHGLVRAQAVALTRLAVAVARTVPALGLIWPGAGTAAPAERLETVLQQIQQDRWPVDIWIGFQLGGLVREGQQLIGARSRGGTAFFGSEIEIFPIPTTDKTRPLRILMQTAGHLMAHGVYLQNGQPVQFPGEPPMQVLLIPASDGRPGVIRLVPAQAGAGKRP